MVSEAGKSRTAYLAITYDCNERCRFCPCSREERDRRDEVCLDDVLEDVETLRDRGCRQIIISGGEPTVHPEFAQIVRAVQGAGLKCVVLSNAERFARRDFLEDLRSAVSMKDLTFIVTLHSHIPSEHEHANGAIGSWERTMTGLNNLIGTGARVILKHCATQANYRDLARFYQWIDSTFPEKVPLQLCGIDYAGLPAEALKAQVLPASDLRPFLEECFDFYLRRVEAGSKRLLYGINIPLCAADPYYWEENRLLRRRNAGSAYDAYRAPGTPLSSAQSDTIGPLAPACARCRVQSVCPGTYKSAFGAFGDSMVAPFY